MKGLKDLFIDEIIDKVGTNINPKYIREGLDTSYQGVKRLFVFPYDNTAADNQVSVSSYQKYFLLRVKIANYNIEIDGRNFYD